MDTVGAAFTAEASIMAGTARDMELAPPEQSDNSSQGRSVKGKEEDASCGRMNWTGEGKLVEGWQQRAGRRV